jgi:hypothetical protein
VVSLEASVLVVGFLNDGPTPTPDDKTLLNFFRLATNIFAKQPERRFLRAFYIYNTSMEPWVFDKAGAYSGELVEMSSDHDSHCAF